MWEFRQGFWHRRTRVSGLSYGVVSLILGLAIFVQLRLVTDGCCNQYTNIEDAQAGDESAEMLDVDDENLEDEKEENADRHGVPDEDETDDNDDYVDDGWMWT